MENNKSLPIIPPGLISSLKNIRGFEENSWLAAHASPGPVSIRFNKAKLEYVNRVGLPGGIPGHGYAEGREKLEGKLAFKPVSQVPWCSTGFYIEERPSFTLDPLFHAGAYYVQEASSMFVEQAFKTLEAGNQSLRVLDLCAAPGGKSTLLQSLLPAGSLLVSNEVIKSRAGILEENLTKWGGDNTVVSNNDPNDFARLPGFFHGVLVDAPCSGSGLFRKDPGAVSEWSPANVTLCAQRQQRILADIWPALRENGWLIYSTCSYSQEENEDIADWIVKELDAEPVAIPLQAGWGIIETGSPLTNSYGYRFFPDKLNGEGFFLACFRKKATERYNRLSGTANFPPASITKKSKGRQSPQVNKIPEAAASYLIPGNYNVIPVGDMCTLVPEAIYADILLLQQELYLKKAGVMLGKPAHKEWIPDHALALSTVLNASVPAWELDKTTALAYLRREEITATAPFRGWGLVCYEGFRLGWIKALPNRINNYYPSSWRIMKRALPDTDII